MNSQIPAPYVGPRTFRETERHRFFGRESEARDLLALVVSERLVIFYAQSGAGKSSLVNTCLIPDLRKRGYEILTGRLVGDAPDGVQPANIFVFNLLRSLAPKERDSAALSSQTISGFMLQRANMPAAANQASNDGEADSVALIIDQFEEIFTTHDDAWEKRAGFFQQLAQALNEEPFLTIVLVMREDFIASLDPYSSLVPGRFRRRYYMQRLEHDAALEAIRGPVAKIRPFEDGVAERLVDDLSGIKMQIPGEEPVTQPGQYVEAVQLQVACLRLWKTLEPGKTITHADLDKLGKVDLALEEHYADRVREVAARKDASERLIREWFGNKLITPNGARNMVLRDTRKIDGQMRDDVIRELLGDLVRMEQRGAASFYELTHDRLVEPILSNNRKWFQSIFQRSSLLQQKTTLWAEQNKTETLLSNDDALVELEQYAGKNPDEVTDLVREYLGASRQKQKLLDDHRDAERAKLELAQKLADEQARSAQQLRKALRTSSLIAGIASLLLLLAIALGIQSNNYQRASEMTVLLNASSIEFQKDQYMGALLAYQALQQFSDRGEVEQAVANILYDLKDREQVETNFLVRTTNGLGSIVFNPADGGQTFAAGYVDGTIYLMDVDTRRQVVDPLTAHTANVASLSYSPDGKMLASGSYDGTVILWDVEAHKLAAQLTGHTNQVNSVVFSPDGKVLASGSYDGTVILWDVETQKVIESPLIGHTSSVTAVAFSPDGKTLASSSWDGTIILRDVAAPTSIIDTLTTAPLSSVSAIAFSPDGKTLASATFNSIYLWNVADRQTITEPEPLVGDGYEVTSLQFNPVEENILAAGQGDGTVILWDVEKQTRFRHVKDRTNRVTGVAFSPDGKSLAEISSLEGHILLWSVDTGIMNGSIIEPVQKDKTAVTAMSITLDGDIQGITGTNLIVWKRSEQRISDTLELDPANPVKSLESIDRIFPSAFSRDGSLRADGGSTSLIVTDINSGASTRFPHDANVRVVAFDHSGEYVASGDESYLVRIWNAKSGEQVAEIENEFEAYPVSLSFSPDASRIAIAYNDSRSTVEVWDVESEQKILFIADRQLQPLSYTLAGSGNLFGRKDDASNQDVAPQIGNPVADIAYLKDDLFIVYSNGTMDHWDIWPSRDEIEARALRLCDPCALTPVLREQLGLYTWPMRVQDYSGYLITTFLALVYGFGVRKIYGRVIKKPISVDQHAKTGFTWHKFLSAIAQGAALTLLGLLGCGTIGLIESIFYSDYARDSSTSILSLLLLLLPLGLWAGGIYSHLTRLQIGKFSRIKRVAVGTLAGLLAGSVSGVLGFITLGYVVTRDLASILDPVTILNVLLIVGIAEGFMSLIGSAVYIFVLQPLSERRKISRKEQFVLQLLFGAGMFFDERKPLRRWIYPIAVLALVAFWPLVPPFDVDYNYLNGDIVSDSAALLTGSVGLVIYLLGLADSTKSPAGSLLWHLFLGVGLFSIGSKSLRRWIYPLALLLVLMALAAVAADLDYRLLGIDVLPDNVAASIGVFAFVIYAVGFVDTILSFRKTRRSVDRE